MMALFLYICIYIYIYIYLFIISILFCFVLIRLENYMEDVIDNRLGVVPFILHPRHPGIHIAIDS